MNLSDAILRSTRALQPAATSVGAGTLYFVTDELITERSDGAVWQSYSGSGSAGITALTGDVTATGPGSVAATIANDAVITAKILNANVTLAKIVDISAASKLLGRGDSGLGVPEEITLGTGLAMIGTTLSSSGGGGATAFTGLTDVPSSYTGQASKVVSVKADVSGLEFTTPSGGTSKLLVAEVTLSDAQIRSLATTPIQIVAAPGANLAIIPVAVMFKGVRSGTAFSGDPIFTLRWATISNAFFGNVNFTFNSVVAATLYRYPILGAFSGTTSDNPVNRAVNVVGSADQTLGTGCSVKVSFSYYIGDYS